MRNRRRQRTSPVERLRTAIDCLPLATREAMLAAVRANERIIAGAYVDAHGGVCPMLAAHRAGARTDFLSFARSWDRFARVSGTARAATERELRILVAHLEASVLEASVQDARSVELDVAIAEHRQLVSRARRRDRQARARQAARALPDAADPRGQIIVRRLRYIVSPGRMNMISGITHAGDTFSR